MVVIEGMLYYPGDPVLKWHFSHRLLSELASSWRFGVRVYCKLTPYAFITSGRVETLSGNV
eukprot:977490-Amphidinium_carterae.1